MQEFQWSAKFTVRKQKRKKRIIFIETHNVSKLDKTVSTTFFYGDATMSHVLLCDSFEFMEYILHAQVVDRQPAWESLSLL